MNRNPNPPTFNVEWCGTHNGYQIHLMHYEKACEACLVAAREYQRWRRFRRGEQHTPFHCPKCGSVFYEHRCTFKNVKWM